MARKRMISPEIWASSSFAELSDFAKIVFIGLISNADDEGKGESDSALLKSTLFPRDEKKRAADVKSALSEIARSTSTLFYSVEGKNYYVLTKWKVYQKLDRPTPSKIPDPPHEFTMGERGSYTQNQILDEDSTKTRRELDEGSTLEENKNMNKNRKRENARAYDIPSVDEITTYCKERNNAVDPQRFFDYYTANGWMIGKNHMRDWRAVVRRWETNGVDNNKAPDMAPQGIVHEKYSEDFLNGLFTTMTGADNE